MRVPTFVVAIAALFATSACWTMKQVTIDDLGAQRTSRVWVTQADQTTVLVHDAQVFRGKLVGFVEGKYREMPQDGLREMRVRKLATARTMGVVAAGIAGFAVAAVLVSGGLDNVDVCANDLCDDP